MPTTPRARPTRKNGSLPSVDSAEITPQEIAAIRSSVQSSEQAPTSRQQAGINVNWSRVRDQLGDPFDVERIPLSRLKLMRRDPMLGFGLSFIRTPFARASWHINAKDVNGPNAQVAANVDWALRRIFASYVFQWSNILDFGFQAIAKRYELRTPTGTYIDTNPDSGERQELPLWSEGNIQPIVWKPFVAMSPEVVEPIWTPQGDFGGIKYNAGSSGGGAPSGVGATAGSDKSEFNIDVYHSLWVTHDKEQNFGSIFGYPRLGYAYRYWWSYWFRWAIADQAFEKKADPGVVVRHPDGAFEQDGQIITYREYALEMGQRLRSGATISLPSEVYMGEIDGKPSGVRMWDIEPLKDLINFDPFDKSFDYLDVQKLRSLWIPEQAFLEGKGGTSSRNVAKEVGESFVESQAVLSSQLVESINRWIIPQFLAANFPEFIAAQGTAEVVMEGFADQDVDARNEILQLIGQQDFGARELMKFVDLEKVLADTGMPILSFAEQKALEAKIATEQQQAQGPTTVTEPVPGQSVGVVPTSTGFNGYIQPREVIYLSDSSSEFIEKLPATNHYTDPTVRRQARAMWEEWRSMFTEEYSSFAEFLENQDAIELAEPSDNVRKLARNLVRAWETNVDKLGTVLDRTTDLYKKIMSRASKLQSDDAKLNATATDEMIDRWIKNHAAEMVSTVSFTTREELTDFLARNIADGVTDPKELANRVRDNFTDFSDWKADRLARTEVRDAFNASTLLTAQANGINQVQALDGNSDEMCRERNGRIFDVDSAFKEKEHPNGTLGWRIVPVAFSYSYSEEPLPEGVSAIYDEENHSVLFSQDVSDNERAEYLLKIGQELAAA